ncbi:PKD-like family protein [Chitinophaga costaii]|uniref:PKD-like family protein n=1 Tax=Chitinophaga costaii TaxID=1335309 RepID=A0A1C4AXC7_9BACT|nr:PKD-like family lipoprotein [Chitinophaga costaii]PUZ26788.1 hypothetical protein DCM91_10345 [Chitinophaga costaii]SCB99293.1 PKD-like family protein [Chitinophaga costaii]
MKKKPLYILVSGLLLLAACAKDKSNYNYKDIPSPTVTGLDTTYTVVLGDSLIINPSITVNTGPNNYSLHWRIDVPEQLKSLNFDGNALRMLFGLGASTYNARLTITDNNNGQEYFQTFSIKGVTQFSKGTLILSTVTDHSVLSFLTPKDSLESDIYTKFNPTPLPAGGAQLAGPLNHNYLNATVDKFYIRYTGDGSGALQISSSTMGLIRTFAQNFFGPPPALNVQGLYETNSGTVTGIFSGKVYWAYLYTAPQFPAYGTWGTPVGAGYNISAHFIQTDSYQLGFDVDKKRFVRFAGGITYLDTTYTIPIGDTSFNPKNLKMDMVYLTRFSDDKCYAIVDSAGKKKELRFGIGFNDANPNLAPESSTRFKGDSLVTTTTLWTSSPLNIVYFSSNGAVYSFNLDNKFLTKLATDFDGQPISLLKIMDSGATLVVGTPGKLSYLNLSTGHNGDVSKTITNIVGSPTDILVLNN